MAKQQVLMTLAEALEIKKAINDKEKIQKIAGGKFIRMNPSYVNLAAGLTESWCKQTGNTCLTRVDVESLYQHHNANWTINKKDQTAWGRMIQCQKILEHWDDKDYDLVGDDSDKAGKDRKSVV